MSGTITACHDPSRIIEDNGAYTIYSTGGLINVRTSPDLVTWSWGSGVFSAIPSWMTSIASSVGDTLDNIWAPDAILASDGSGGTHYLNYYSRDIGSGTTEHAVCGVATATSPAGPWTDQGAMSTGGAIALGGTASSSTGAGTGGSASTGGSTPNGTGTGTGGATNSSSTGAGASDVGSCSCRTAGESKGHSALLMSALGVLALGMRRRRNGKLSSR